MAKTNKNEAKIKFVAETEQFNKQIKAANGELGALRAELSLNATEMKGLSDTTEKLTERKALLEKELETAASKTEALRGKMAAATRVYGENSNEVLSLKKQITLATTAEVKIRQEIDKVNGTLEEQAAALDKHEKKAVDARSALEKLEDTVAEQEKAMEALVREYKEAIVIADGESEASRRLEREMADLSKELNENKQRLARADSAADDFSKSLKGVDSSADKASKAVDDAGKQAEDSAEGWTIVKDVIADLASKAVQAAADAFEDLLLSGEAALDMLMVKTDLSSEVMGGLGEAAYDVFNNGWGESLSDVTDSMSTVYTMMGDMDWDYLSEYTENAMTLSDVWGYDVAESIRAVNALEKQFGLTGEEAFNLILQGAQLGLDQNGDMLDTINEYSVQFARAGYSADDMFNMLKNGAVAGTWSIDKLGDAFKEFNIRVTDGTVSDALMENRKALGMTQKEVKKLTADYGKGGEAGKAAMKKTLDAVLSVEDETERYKLGVELFGTMWEDLGEDAITALLDTEGIIKSTNNSMSQVKTDAYDNLATSISTLGRTLKNDLLIPIVNSITPAIKGIVDWAIEHMDILKPIIVGVATAFGVLAGALAISGIISGVQKAFALLNTTLLANPITLIIAAVAGLVAAFIYLWNNCEGFRNFWINLWNIVKTAFNDAWNWIVNFFTVTLPEAWNATITAISAFVASAIAWFGNLASGIGQWVSNAYTSVTTWFSNIYTSITTWISNAYNSVATWFGNILTSISTIASNIWSSVSTWFSNIGTTISTACSNIWTNATNVWNNIKSAIQTPIESAKKLVSDAVGGIKNKVTSIFDTVKSKVTSVWNSIKSAIENPINTAKQTVMNVVDAIKSAFDFDWSFPKPKFPKFQVSGGEAPWGFMGQGSLPSVKVVWNAKGAVVDEATIFGMSGNTLLGAGEAGPEAIAPIDVLLGYVTDAVRNVFGETVLPMLNADNRTFADRLESSNNFMQFERMVDAIENLADRPIVLNIDGQRIATATASASDAVSGNRLNLRTRGLALT